MANVQIDIKANSSQAEQELKNLTNTVSGFKQKFTLSFTEIQNALVLFEKGLQMAKQAFQQTVQYSIDYAMSVDDVSRALGVNAQEASTLIQVADDLRISQESLTMAMRTALKQGITPNINGLIAMSKEYNALTTPAEKAQYALEKFGRNGLEMQRVLELDETALRSMAEAAKNSGLVINDAVVKQAEEARLAMDEFSDSIDALKLNLGVELLGASQNGATGIAKVVQTTNNQIVAMRMVKDAIDQGVMSQQQWAKMAIEVRTGDIAWADVIDEVTSKIDEHNQEIDRLTSAQEDNTIVVEDATTSYEWYSKALQIANYQAAKAERVTGETVVTLEDMNEQLAKNAKEAAGLAGVYEELSPKMESFFDGIDRDLGSPIESFIKDLQWMMAGGADYSAQFAGIQTALAEGIISPTQAAAMGKDLLVAVNQGLVDAGLQTNDEAANAVSEALGVPVDEAKAKLAEFASGIDALTANEKELMINIEGADHTGFMAVLDALMSGKSWTVTFKGSTSGGGSGGSSGGGNSGYAYNNPNKAQGQHGLDMVVPPGYNSDNYTVGVSSGERVQVVPAGNSSAGAGGNFTINIYGATDAKAAGKAAEEGAYRAMQRAKGYA